MKNSIALSICVLSAYNTVQAKEKTEAPRPNILFCLADDASFPFLGAYGCKWVRTPHIDYIANNGILFLNNYTCNAKSAPSRSSILTGRNSWQLDEACNHFPFFPEKFKTFPEVLRENNYEVAQTGKAWSPGDPGMKDGKPRQLIGKAFDSKKLIPASKGISNNDYAANFNDFLAQRDHSKPFFFWFGSLEPHRDYEFSSGIRYGGYHTNSIDRVPDYWPDNDSVRTDMLDFAFELEHFDNQVGKMLEMLQKQGILDNTIIIVTADNGMPFPRVKGQAYHASNHLPLAIMWGKGIQMPGRKNADFVTFADIAPTILELTGINFNQSGMQPIVGKSIVPIFSNANLHTDPKRSYALIGKERHDIGRPNDEGYPIRGIVNEHYLYIHNFETERWPVGNPETGYLNCDGGATKSFILNNQKSKQYKKYWQMNFGKRPHDELYDLKSDPDCVYNLAEQKNYSKLKNKLKSTLFAELKKQGDPRMFGNGALFDQYKYSDPDQQNYYNRIINGENVKFPGWIEKTDVDQEALKKAKESCKK